MAEAVGLAVNHWKIVELAQQSRCRTVETLDLVPQND